MSCYIDDNFINLINEIQYKSIHELYIYMVEKFKQISYLTRKSFEDFFKKFEYWGNLNNDDENYDFIYKKAVILKKNLKNYIWLYKNLEDYKSKFILYSIINNYYNFDFVNLKKSIEPIFKSYFDLDLIKVSNNEVFVDVGAYTGDSVIDYISSFGKHSYSKIYCYEITETTINIMKNNLKNYNNIIYKNCAVGKFNKYMYFEKNEFSSSANKIIEKGKSKIKCVTLDKDIKEKISIIKMDIEGGEKDALIGAKNHVLNDSPLLLISVYHNNKDLFEIPQLIYDINKNYKFYLRYNGGPIYPTEIKLICIPN